MSMTLPYPEPDGTRTAGWSGSDASHERALDEVSSGVLGKRLFQVLEFTEFCGKRGVTVADVRELGLHHGQASSALTTLHQQGRIARLADRRNRCHIYVAPEYVAGRETQEPRRNRPQVIPEGVTEGSYADGGADMHDEVLRAIWGVQSDLLAVGRIRRAHYTDCWKDHGECLVSRILDKVGEVRA